MVRLMRRKQHADAIQNSTHTPYLESIVLQKLLSRIQKRLAPRIAFLDIDATLTGDPKDTDATRLLLEKHGFCVVFVTARTEEMIMSEPVYQKSHALGFKRPQPHLLYRSGKYTYIPPEKIEPEGILNPDIIAGSSGTQILVRQQSGAYLIDHERNSEMVERPEIWKKRINRLIKVIDSESKLAIFSPLEDPRNFRNHLTDVYPIQYRTSLMFRTCNDKVAFVKKFAQVSKINKYHALTTNCRIIDDSHPQKQQFAIEITPQRGGKLNSVNHIIKTVRAMLPTNRPPLEILIAGDKYQDLRMGLKAAQGAKVTYIIPGGATITEALIHKSKCTFAGEDFTNIRSQLRQQKTGRYLYGISGAETRQVIIGDEAYLGRIGVETIYSFLQEYGER